MYVQMLPKNQHSDAGFHQMAYQDSKQVGLDAQGGNEKYHEQDADGGACEV